MRNSLHPTILFHFTKRKKALFGILKETFKLSYARERIYGLDDHRDLGVPMVSFCDLKLHDIKDHISNYGSYGIGLTKEWANSQGLNPFLYTNRHCPLIADLMRAFTNVHNHIQEIPDPLEYAAMADNVLNIQNIYRYLKNYEGPLTRRGKIVDHHYRFADEREWRYVPPLNTEGVMPFLPISYIDTATKKTNWNRRINHALSFQPDDIRYLIVKNDNDIDQLLGYLQKVKSRFPEETIRRLSSRILTADQINKDV